MSAARRMKASGIAGPFPSVQIDYYTHRVAAVKINFCGSLVSAGNARMFGSVPPPLQCTLPLKSSAMWLTMQ